MTPREKNQLSLIPDQWWNSISPERAVLLQAASSEPIMPHQAYTELIKVLVCKDRGIDPASVSTPRFMRWLISTNFAAHNHDRVIREIQQAYGLSLPTSAEQRSWLPPSILDVISKKLKAMSPASVIPNGYANLWPSALKEAITPLRRENYIRPTLGTRLARFFRIGQNNDFLRPESAIDIGIFNGAGINTGTSVVAIDSAEKEKGKKTGSGVGRRAAIATESLVREHKEPKYISPVEAAMRQHVFRPEQLAFLQRGSERDEWQSLPFDLSNRDPLTAIKRGAVITAFAIEVCDLEWAARTWSQVLGRSVTETDILSKADAIKTEVLFNIFGGAPIPSPEQVWLWLPEKIRARYATYIEANGYGSHIGHDPHSVGLGQ